jgi:hypothetical protein
MFLYIKDNVYRRHSKLHDERWKLEQYLPHRLHVMLIYRTHSAVCNATGGQADNRIHSSEHVRGHIILTSDSLVHFILKKFTVEITY